MAPHTQRRPDARRVISGSEKKAWWTCRKGADHVWLAVIRSRTRLGAGCPSCAGKRVSGTNSLAALHPQIAAQWHPTKNGDLTPDRVVVGSERKAWWKCPQGADHVWLASISQRTGRGSGCPYCAGQKVSGTNSLAASHPQIAAQWHPTLNGELTPDRVVAGSSKKAWWKCPQGADHVWSTEIASRTSAGAGCPSCAGQKVSTTNSLAALFPEIAGQWHPTKNGGVTPDDVTTGSSPQGTDHVWLATIDQRTHGGSGCPSCEA
jgi:positive regulator of sigma E activity